MQVGFKYCMAFDDANSHCRALKKTKHFNLLLNVHGNAKQRERAFWQQWLMNFVPITVMNITFFLPKVMNITYLCLL